MKRCFFFGLACLALVLPRAQGAEYQAGLYVADITPPPGYRMSGYFNERLNTGTHDPLLAKAVYLRTDTTEAALIFCDLIGISLEVSGQARRQIEQTTGIPAAHVLIHGTHSHTGPLYSGALRKHFHDLAVAKHGKDPQEAFDYPGFLVEKLSGAVVEARSSAVAAKLHAGIALQRGLSFNRRFHMRNGSVQFNPGKLNPEIIRPAGPIDPDVGLVLFSAAADQRKLGALTVFALHLDTVGGTEYAADYPFYLERELKSRVNNRFISLFGNGTCGDINHIDITHNRPQKGHEEAQRIGTALAETVHGAIDDLAPISKPGLAVAAVQVMAPLRTYTAAQVEQARKDIFKVGTSQLSFLDQVQAVKIVETTMLPAAESGKRETMALEVQVFRLGDDLALVGLPGEVFVDLGLAIKRRSPFAQTFVIELCNTAPAYIPTKKAFEEGSYETVNSLIAPGGGELIVEAALKLLDGLKAGRTGNEN
jgi:neutral ceramidase